MAKTRKITLESLQMIMDYYFPDAYRVEIEKNWHQKFIEDVFGKLRNADTIELAAARLAPLLREYIHLSGPIQIQFSLMQFAFLLFHKKQWKNHHDALLCEGLEIFKSYLDFDPLSFWKIE